MSVREPEMQSRDARVDVLPDAETLMRVAADAFVQAAAVAIRTTGRFVVALSGGSTPRCLYALLVADRFASQVDWSCVHVCWGDERCLPPDDPASNYRMARETLLDHVPVPAANVHRIRGEDEPARAAAAYERELRALFRTDAGPPHPTAGRRFDLVLLGMGTNGHTASLFPGMAAVRETRRWVVAERVGAVAAWRLSLAPAVINAAAEVVFLVSGREKAVTLGRVLEGPYQPDALPAQVIAPRDGLLRWLVDAAAATELARR